MAKAMQPSSNVDLFSDRRRVAVDAGSIAIALTNEQREKVKDIIVTHPHMDHIASLPIFIDDLYPTLKEPMRVHATQEVIDLLERDIFNWNVYPRFSELKNDFGPVMEYVPIPEGQEFQGGPSDGDGRAGESHRADRRPGRFRRQEYGGLQFRHC